MRRKGNSRSLASLDFITTTAPNECRVSLSLQKTKTRTKGAAMKIIGCDFHPSFQQIAMVDTETGEYTERKLTPEEARQFYAELKGPVLVGMEACGNTLWFERLLASLGIELWLGDAGKIRAMEVRKQKTDRRDAQLLLQLLLENRFPRVWVPSAGAARCAAVAVASSQAGRDAAAGEERVAASGAESGSAAEAQAVERGRTAAAGSVAAEGLDGTAAPGFAGVAGRSGPVASRSWMWQRSRRRIAMRWRACCRRIPESVRSRRWRFR